MGATQSCPDMSEAVDAVNASSTGSQPGGYVHANHLLGSCWVDDQHQQKWSPSVMRTSLVFIILSIITMVLK
ncbi:uncharacterized protein PgNI_04357 [Pyricularia grisea]|uniref:Uncharacterized protein n=1 Tax=Pyricularia grisea TaxID=148305 RepID=A0A6P8B9F5_PYRGI|nr:uncharacterized protein PgNI_04357 [Pyricularia grisea]TLD12455.1 hypothetical protein PgNI_04357 [Pyricularia grisea]